MGWLQTLGFGKKNIQKAQRQAAYASLQARVKSNQYANDLPPIDYEKEKPMSPTLSPVPLFHADGGMYGDTMVKANNGKRNIRAEVFEQNFIRRTYTTFENAISGGEKIRLELYEEKLNMAESEGEAILYYDELVAMINMLILYFIYI